MSKRNPYIDALTENEILEEERLQPIPLSSDSGRLAGELIRAATNLRLREQVNQLRIMFPMAPDGSGPETPDDLKDFEALGDLLDAGNDLFQAFPGLREEVERAE